MSSFLITTPISSSFYSYVNAIYIYIYINIYEVLFFTLSLYYTCYIVVGRNLIPSRHLGISFVLALHLCHPLYFQVISSPLFLCYPFNFLLHPPPLYFICTYIYIYIYISRHLNKQKDFISPPSWMVFKPQIKHNMIMSHKNGWWLKTPISLWWSTIRLESD